MAASDHLSGQQFMPVSELMKLPSMEGDYSNRAEGGHLVGSVVQGKLNDIRQDYQAGNTKYWDGMARALKAGTAPPVHVDRASDMVSEYSRYKDNAYSVAGPGNPITFRQNHPDLSDSPMLGEGHHRIALAAHLGIEKLPVTNSLRKSYRTAKEYKQATGAL